MNGKKAEELGAPVTGGAAVLCLSEKYRAPRESACVRCGRCSDACPIHLTPSMLYKVCAKGKAKKAEKLNINSCIECGACAFICPARLPILEKIREMKNAPPPEISKEKEDAENEEA